MSFCESRSYCLKLQFDLAGMSAKEFDDCLPDLIQFEKGIDGHQTSCAKASQQRISAVAQHPFPDN